MWKPLIQQFYPRRELTNKLPPLPLNRGGHQAGKGGSSNSNQEEELMFVDPKRRRQDGEVSGLDNRQGLAWPKHSGLYGWRFGGT